MNELKLVLAVLAYIPIKGMVLFFCGYAVCRLAGITPASVAEAMFLSLSVGMVCIFALVSIAVFGGFFTRFTCLAFMLVVLCGGAIWLAVMKRSGEMPCAPAWANVARRVRCGTRMPQPFYWLVWGALVSLAVVSALVPSLDFEVFRWLRPIASAARAGRFVAQPEEIMFWLPQTAQFIDGFTLALLGEISFVAADRMILLVALFLGMQVISIRIFDRDLSPIAMLAFLANETGTYLFPHAFLKGHVLSALLGLASIHLYLTTPLRLCSGRRRLLLGGVMTGVAASVTFHAVFLPIAMGIHSIIVAVREAGGIRRLQREFSDRLRAALLYFVPAGLITLLWMARNIVMTGHPTYPYGIYFPRSGGFGASGTFSEYVIAHAELAKPFGYAFNTHTAGPFLVAGFVLSLGLWMFRGGAYAVRFFGLAALISVFAFVGSYAFSNISPRYYMYWLAVLALCLAAACRPLRWSGQRPFAPSNIALSALFLLGLAGLAHYIVLPAISQVRAAMAAGDFRRVTPQPPSIVAYANDLNRRDPTALWATPLILGADYFLETSNVMTYGWPPFPTSLKLLAAQTSDKSYEALRAAHLKYLMYFRIMPTNMYRVYDWDETGGHAVRISYGAPHRSSLRQTLAVFDIDDKGALLRYDSRFLHLHMTSEPYCAYLDLSGCSGGEANKEPHYLFEIRSTPDLSAGWVDVVRAGH